MKKVAEDDFATGEASFYSQQIEVANLTGGVDYEEGLPEGNHGPTYQLNFGKTQVRVLKDRQIIMEVPVSKMRPGVSNSDYKCVKAMMEDVKSQSLDSWRTKYFLED